MGKKIVGICACPIGIAHTYMAADAIEEAAKELGCNVKVETQGSLGIENKLTEDDLKSADLIIVSTAIKLKEEERLNGFENKRVDVELKTIISKAKDVINEKLA